MAKLSSFGVKVASQLIRFVGEPEETGLTDRDGVPYFIWKLAEPIMVRCSTVPEMPAIEVDALHIRGTLLESELWEMDQKGAYIPNYVADFSKNQEIAIFQETSIRQWSRQDRKERNQSGRTDFLKRIQERIAAKVVETK